MRHTYYTCDRCGRSSLSTAGIIVLTAGSYTQDEIDHDPDLDNMSEDEMTVHLCPICWGKVKRMIESKRVADDEPRPDHGQIVDDDPEVSVTPITPDDADKILSGEIKRKCGKWNAYYHGINETPSFTYSCNQCGYSAPYGLYGGKYSQKKWNFCPSCGADMRGEQDG